MLVPPVTVKAEEESARPNVVKTLLPPPIKTGTLTKIVMLRVAKAETVSVTVIVSI